MYNEKSYIEMKEKRTIQSIFASIANEKRKCIEVVESSLAYTDTIHKRREAQTQRNVEGTDIEHNEQKTCMAEEERIHGHKARL